MTVAERLELVRAAARRADRAAGRPVCLTSEEVQRIRRELLAGATISDLAERYGVTVRRIRLCAKGTAALSTAQSLLVTVREAAERRATIPAYPRECEICLGPYTVKRKSSPQRTCSHRCAGHLANITQAASR